MYIILDKDLNRIGSLSLDGHGSCPFYQDEIDIQIAGEDGGNALDTEKSTFNTDSAMSTKSWGHTLTSIYVPAGYPETDMIANGNSLAYKDELTEKWYIMRLTDVTDVLDASGTHLKSAVGVNLAIWNLTHTMSKATTLTRATCEEAFRWLLQDSTWTIGELNYTGGTATITFDKTASAQSMLQTLCQTYDCEVDAYVQFDKTGRIIQKRIDIVAEMGQDLGATVRYAEDLTNITRVVSDGALYTKLFVYGANDATIDSVNGGRGYVTDEKANDLYGANILGDKHKTYLEGSVTSETIANKTSLLAWGKNVLSKYNHPRAVYTIDVNSGFTAQLGDTIKVIDEVMNPVLSLTSRVIQKKISQADPNTNQVVLGEFVAVTIKTSSLIDRLQANQTNIVNLINEAQKNGKALTIELMTPDGTDWGQNDKVKRVIARVFINGQNVTTYFEKKAFLWTKTDENGIHDDEWETKQLASGNYLEINPDVIGNIMCQIELDKYSVSAEVEFIEDDATKYFVVNDWVNHWGDPKEGSIQYMQIDKKNGYIYASLEYKGSQQAPAPSVDTHFARFTTAGVYVDSMILQGGGHGSSFGLEFIADKPVLWTNLSDYSQSTYTAYVAKVPYQANKVIPFSDSSITKLTKSGYFGRINLDDANGKVLATHTNGDILVADKKDVLAGKWKTNYLSNVSNYGVRLEKQTLQSNVMDYPYVFFNTGNADQSDKQMVYCVNVITKSLVFAHEYVYSTITNPLMRAEPQTVGILVNGKAKSLVHGFSTRMTAEAEHLDETLWLTPLTYRVDDTSVPSYPDEPS